MERRFSGLQYKLINFFNPIRTGLLSTPDWSALDTAPLHLALAYIQARRLYNWVIYTVQQTFDDFQSRWHQTLWLLRVLEAVYRSRRVATGRLQQTSSVSPSSRNRPSTTFSRVDPRGKLETYNGPLEFSELESDGPQSQTWIESSSSGPGSILRVQGSGSILRVRGGAVSKLFRNMETFMETGHAFNRDREEQRGTGNTFPLLWGGKDGSGVSGEAGLWTPPSIPRLLCARDAAVLAFVTINEAFDIKNLGEGFVNSDEVLVARNSVDEFFDNLCGSGRVSSGYWWYLGGHSQV